MMRQLRWKLVRTAMLSLLILLMILIGCTGAFGYLSMERAADTALDRLTEEKGQGAAGEKEALKPRSIWIFGYRLDESRPMAHFTVLVSADRQEYTARVPEFLEITREEAVSWARDVVEEAENLEAGEEISGKLGACKYRIVPEEEGGYTVYFLDNSAQVRMLTAILAGACLISLACMGLMFGIVLIVSARAVKPFAANLEKQKEFITNAGHEIKTPLAIMLTNVDAMELCQGTTKWSRNIRNQILRLNGLTRKLLLLAKAEEQGVPAGTEEVDLDGLTRRMAETFEEPALQKGIGLHAELCGKAKVQGDLGALEQLLEILFDNAVKYAPKGGKVWAVTRCEGKRKRLLVYNSLERLPDVPPASLFDRFYRGDTARTQTGGGYGIGLSAAGAIARQHRGRLFAVYEDAHTICFVLELP